MTFSIAARDFDPAYGTLFGVAAAGTQLCVGLLTPAARAGAGAVAVPGIGEVSHRPAALDSPVAPKPLY